MHTNLSLFVRYFMLQKPFNFKIHFLKCFADLNLKSYNFKTYIDWTWN
jgi:hypothetical protein